MLQTALLFADRCFDIDATVALIGADANLLEVHRFQEVLDEVLKVFRL